MVGNSPELRQVLADLERIRHSDTTVHLRGETGTGKELVARGLHLSGPRSDAPFVALNCGGMTETLLESTLFGHKKGAFTGADRDHQGLFQQADGGTLFLDQVEDLPAAVQASFLRALQEKEVKPVGATSAVKVDVRIISATNKDLRDQILLGRFREDLYFRLVVIEVSLPPLRERRGDVPLLVQHFLDLLCARSGKDIPGFTPDAMAVLERYPWPGNIRELENEIERAVVLTDDGCKVSRDQLSTRVYAGKATLAVAVDPALGTTRIPSGLSYDEAVKAFERALIERALKETHGVVQSIETAPRWPRAGAKRSPRWAVPYDVIFWCP